MQLQMVLAVAGFSLAAGVPGWLFMPGAVRDVPPQEQKANKPSTTLSRSHRIAHLFRITNRWMSMNFDRVCRSRRRIAQLWPALARTAHQLLHWPATTYAQRVNVKDECKL